MSFWGYSRPDGSIGARNYVGVISTVACANDVAQWIARGLPECALFVHQQGCGQSQPDMEMVHRTLISLGCNPNLASVLLVSLGCEGPVDDIVQGIAATGKRVDKVVVVTAPADVQRARVLKRPGMTAEKFEAILAKQMPDAEKRKRADFVVDTSQGLDSARRQVRAIIETLAGENAG